ncbi:Eco29kI family restriction endonuclease [Hyphomonas sp.]|uniref:Eco29kI family restriction endonuclease n=1 Tax=Hyphomonas sp. TaxID=87 RepID=UPI003D2CDB06
MRKHPSDVIAKLSAQLNELLDSGVKEALSPSARRQLASDVSQIHIRLDELMAEIDPIRQPDTIFDPADPSVVGRFVALAMVAQKSAPLDTIGKFYGSGIYAIYYNGDFPLYAPISGGETPIYVGKANPQSGAAKTPIEQGPRLSGRLADHRKNIIKAENLDIKQFSYKALVVQTGWQDAAESYLINFFKPIWNSETKILFGLGKHGDNAETRANKRSPWDTLHPGREWAAASKEDAKSIAIIEAETATHFSLIPRYASLQRILDAFISELRQITD